MMNNFYVVSGPNKHHILPRPGWPEILEHVINDCYEADVYDDEGRHITSYKMEGGHLTALKGPLWPENTPRFSGEDCCDEFSDSDSPVGISGHENAVRNFRQLRSYISANQAGEVDLLIAWEKLTQRLING